MVEQVDDELPSVAAGAALPARIDYKNRDVTQQVDNVDGVALIGQQPGG